MKKAALKAKKKSVRERVSVNSINLYAIYWGKVDYAAISHISPKITIFNSTSPSLSTRIYNRSNLVYFTFFFKSFFFFLRLTIKEKQAWDANSKGIPRWATKKHYFYIWFTSMSIRNQKYFISHHAGIARFFTRRC